MHSLKKAAEVVEHAVYAGVANSVLTKIIKADKTSWYKPIVGKPMLLKLYRTKQDATSVSMPDHEPIKADHFIITRGIDVRPGMNNKVYNI